MHILKPTALVSLLMLLLLLSTFSVVNMEQVQFNYSTKNISIPTKKEYLLELIRAVEIFDSNIRWRCFHFLNPCNSNRKETFGFKTTKPAPFIAELKDFQTELYNIVKNIKFKHPRLDALQKKLKDDIEKIKNDDKVYVAADKTSNFYKLTPENHNELLNNNITKDYKKAKDNAVDKINKEDKQLAQKFEIDDRVYALEKRESFITLKDHKDSFQNNPKCRLINPAKSELGKVSKQILTKIIKVVREKTNLEQWINSDSVIKWFGDLQDKDQLSFIQFDICEYYASIRENLLEDSLNFAARYVKITREEKKIIHQARKTLLFSNGKPWNKKTNKDFDVTMGSWDGAEICDLIGLYMLSLMSNLDAKIGLYRDDGLCVCDLRPRQVELLKKKLCKIFKDNGLNITIDANVKNVNFLDINLDLSTNTYKPYMKPNDRPTYVHRSSNHPRGILENIPKSVNKRLSKISANEDIFNSAAPPYQEALASSGYNFKLKFEPQAPNQKKARNRKRKITYFNPPFSSNIKTNVGEQFLKALDKCFPKDHILRKVMNRNTIKISYKCMPNFKREINKHNSKLLKPQTENEVIAPGCNCRDKNEPCPLGGKCLTDRVIYKATVKEDDDTKSTYTGVTKNTFKRRYYGHTSSFRNRDDNQSTTLSSFIWQLKDENKNYDIGWEVIDRGKEFNPTSRKCLLCMKEKYHIIHHPTGSTLNLRSELFSTCRHRCDKLLSKI